MKRLLVLVLVLVLGRAHAAADPNTGRPLDNPVLVRAAARAGGRTNRVRRVTMLSQEIIDRQLVSHMSDGSNVVSQLQWRDMSRPVRVASQSVMAGQLVSRMTDGTTVVAPLKRATTARAPQAVARLRIDRAVARIIAASETTKSPDKQADALEAIATQIEAERAPKPPKKKGKDIAVVGGLAAVVGTGAFLLGRGRGAA